MAETNNNTTTVERANLHEFQTSIDELFLIVNGVLCLLMQPGFALLECGAVRSKNATNILVKNMLDAMISGVAYWLVGYAFAYGKGNFFLGHEYFAMVNMPETDAAKWFFQYVFAATAATIVSGSLAERCDTTAYFVYSFVITAFIYPVVCHWAWTNEGWLNVGSGDAAYKDFAGSGVVHVLGGTCAIVGAYLLGPRIGRYDEKTGEPKEMRGHSLPLTVTGGMILLVGFLPFNGGSLGQISGKGDGAIVARCVVNTTISGSFGGLLVLALVKGGILGKPKVLSVTHALNGALAGMVSICSGVNNMHPWGAAITGLGGGISYLLVHMAVNRIRVDDPLDAVAVHFGGGMWGLIAGPLFAIDGILLTGTTASAKILGWNLAGAVSIITWSGTLSFIMFGLLKWANVLRVDAETEKTGLDLVKHNEPAYPAESWIESQYQKSNKDLQRRQSSGKINASNIK